MQTNSRLMNFEGNVFKDEVLMARVSESLFGDLGPRAQLGVP